jgi:hypothetical protein
MHVVMNTPSEESMSIVLITSVSACGTPTRLWASWIAAAMPCTIAFQLRFTALCRVRPLRCHGLAYVVTKWSLCTAKRSLAAAPSAPHTRGGERRPAAAGAALTSVSQFLWHAQATGVESKDKVAVAGAKVPIPITLYAGFTRFYHKRLQTCKLLLQP